MEPLPSGSSYVWPWLSTMPPFSFVRLLSSVRVAVSSTYTFCGRPESRPRSPTYEFSCSCGRSSSGSAENAAPFSSSTAVGRKKPTKPSWSGRASGTLMVACEP